MAGVLKVLGLCGVGLEVPSVADARSFYSAFGLETVETTGGLAFRSPGRDSDDLLVLPAREKRLHHVSFFAGEGTQERFAEQLGRQGVQVTTSPPDGVSRAGLWFQDPWGVWIHLEPRNPVPSREVKPVVRHPDQALWQEIERRARPLRIGHMLMYSGEWEKAERWYSEMLGLRTTDRIKGKVVFMAAGEGETDHHCFGIINGTHRGFQHASFQVENMDAIGFGAWKLREAGYRRGFGPGRHAVASNLFHYTQDPWGSWVEYYADMDRITERWQTRDWETLPYIWGPEWSPEFWGKEMNGNHEPR